MGNEQSAGQGGHRADYRHHQPLPPRAESKAEEAERLNRAAAYDDKLKRFQRRDPEQIKKENWQKYQAIGTAKPANATNSTNTSPLQSATSLSANVPPPPAHFNTTSAANRPPPHAVQTGYPGSAAGYQQPKRPVTGGAGYSGTAAHSTPAAASAAQLPADPNRARAARAAAMMAKTAKIKTYSKGGGKTDQWETYKQLEALEQQKSAPVPARHSPHRNNTTAPTPSSDEKRDDNTAASTDDADAAAAAAAYGDEADEDGDAFYQQMFHLIQKAQAMPTASLQLLIRVISNLVRADPADPNAAKYRRLKLDNEKVQTEIVGVEGALEVLFAVGFERREGEAEGGEGGGMSGERLECVTEDMTMAMLALEKLNAVLDARK